MEQNMNSESHRDVPAEATTPGETRPVPLLGAHMPEFVEPLESRQLETVFTETRRLRHDGWTPEKKRLFLQRFAECGVFVEACEAAGMSARAAYNLRDRDPLFAAGLDAACVKARAPLADEAYSRARNGIVERVYRDGIVVAEKHRYDNRLTMAVLARLDSRIDRAEEKGAAHLLLVERWDEYLDALGEDRRDDLLALLAPPEPAPPAPRAGSGAIARDRELHELRPGEEPGIDDDPHSVWEDEDGCWTDYPPPAGFDGEEEGSYGDHGYRRLLSPEEQAVVDSELAEEDAEEAEAMAAERAVAEAQRDLFFGFGRAAKTAGLGSGGAAAASARGGPPSIPCDSRATHGVRAAAPGAGPMPGAAPAARAEGEESDAEGP
jgi:hypothetical protein